MDEGLREPCLNMAAYYTLVWNTIFHGSYLVLQYSSTCTSFIPYVLVKYSLSTQQLLLKSDSEDETFLRTSVLILFFPIQSRNQISLLDAIYELSCSHFIFLLKFKYYCSPKFCFLPRITRNKLYVSSSMESRQVGDNLVW